MTIKVTGLKEVEAQLRKLGSKDGTRVLRFAMLQATKPIEEQAKTNAGAIPGGSGALQKSIGKRFVVGRLTFSATLPEMGGRFSVVIGPLKGNRVAVALYNLFYRRSRKKIFHGHFVEFGTKRSRRQKFLEPALNSRAGQAVQNLAGEIKKGIERLLKRR
jgi:HK97 gp10 family phage protein